MSEHTLTVDDSWRYGRNTFVEGPSNSYKPLLRQVHRDNTLLVNVKAGTSTGFGLLGEVEKYFDKKKELEHVGRSMRLMAAIENIERQLAHDQRAVIDIDPETGLVRSIQRPGHAYMDNPDAISHFSVSGDDEGMSWVDARENTQFKVKDVNGAEKIIFLDEEWSDKGRDSDVEKLGAPKRRRDDDFPYQKFKDKRGLP